MKNFTKAAVIGYIVSIFAYILTAITEAIYNSSPMRIKLSEYLGGLIYMPIFILPYVLAIGLIISLLVNKLVKKFYIKLIIYIFCICILSFLLTPIIPSLELNYAKIIFIICLLIFILLIEKFKIFKQAGNK